MSRTILALSIAAAALFSAQPGRAATALTYVDGPSAAATDAFDPDAFGRTFNHREAIVAGAVRLHFVTGGSGPPVVLLHGWPETWYEWRRMMPALAERRTVIAVDLRGLGDSDRPPSGYDKRTLGRDVSELMAQLGHGRFDLVGHDWGASVAYSIAHERPGSVGRLVLSDNLLPGVPATGPAARALLDKIWHLRFMQQPGLPEAVVPGRERAFYGYIYRDWTVNHAAFTPDYLEEFVRAYSRPGALEAGAGYYRALAEDAAVFARYAERKLPMPVLAVTGEKLIGAALQEQVAPVAEDFRGVVIRSCGHFLPIDCPAEYLAVLLPFLAAGDAP